MSEIILKFDLQSGETKIEAKGYQGSSCQDATKFLKALGNVTDFKRKAEWYEQNLTLTGTVNSNLCG